VHLPLSFQNIFCTSSFTPPTMHFTPLALFSLATLASATTLFIGSYGGRIHTAQLSPNGTLTALTSTNHSAPSPSWQELSPVNRSLLYTVEETSSISNLSGAVTSYLITNGSLHKLSSALGPLSPVSLSISPTGDLLFTANYGTSSVSAYSTSATGELQHLQDWAWNLTAPGAVPDRQEASHPHQALFDATGRFVLVPDLGADLIRVFEVCTGEVKELSPVAVASGTGPRHGAWYPPAPWVAQFYYLVGELSNTVSVFSVLYEAEGISLSLLQTVAMLPANTTTGAAAEIVIAPGGKYVYASNRFDGVFKEADSIAVFERDIVSGLLTSRGLVDSGEQNLRHITMHPKGRFLLAEGQNSGEISVLKVDNSTGRPGEIVGRLQIESPVCVTWER
jgi:6-phosphogluconolactonase